MIALRLEELVERLLTMLDARERAGAVVYYAEEPLAAGVLLDAPGVQVMAPSDAFVGFVDREPRANWGHSCRYVLIDREGGEALSIEAQLPPFGSTQFRWRVAYKAESVPDAAVAVSYES